MVTGLLTIALVFFVFAQAALIRSDGQSAADAAALAAATEARDQLYDGFLDALDGEGDLGDILAGEDFEVGSACDEAARLADLNDARLGPCDRTEDRPGFTVHITTRDDLGDTLIPGTEGQVANARATAVIESRCEIADEADDEVRLGCEDGEVSFDPDDEDERPDARDLFLVYLAD